MNERLREIKYKCPNAIASWVVPRSNAPSSAFVTHSQTNAAGIVVDAKLACIESPSELTVRARPETRATRAARPWRTRVAGNFSIRAAPNATAQITADASRHTGVQGVCNSN